MPLSALSHRGLRRSLRVLPFVWLALAGSAHAGTWALPGDLALRSDLQLLSDSGLLHIPLSAWPVSLADVERALRDNQATDLDPAVQAAYLRTRSRLRAATRPGVGERQLTIELASDPVRLRGFQDTPREEAGLGFATSWNGDYFNARLQAIAVADPEDDRPLRLDGSYAGLTLGNWTLAFGSVPRWWGPGYDGSIILGTAARPVPALMLEREHTLPIDFPILRWLGPWDFSGFIGQLESDRHIPEAKLIGIRITLKPTERFELGLSRTAQWGGEGRPESFDSFVNLMLGRDNRGDSGITIDNEPGNQLAGLDFRWRSPLFGNWPYAIYGQLIGEDEAGGMPSRHLGMAGIEHWGSAGGVGYRAYFEWADTACNFYDDPPGYNCAYEHTIYRDGYRYRGQPLGHALDNDSRMLSLGLVLTQADGNTWGLILQRAELNRDGRDSTARGHALSPHAASERRRLQLMHARSAVGGWLELAFAADESDLSGSARWTLAW